MRHLHTLVSGIAIAATTLASGCAGGRAATAPANGITVVPAPNLATASRTYTYAPDADRERVRMLMFVTISPDYLADRAEFFARNGIEGFMMSGLIGSWENDIWRQPTHYTPDTPEGRIVGATNPLLEKCRRMNERCRAAGIRYNSVKVAFYTKLPDWFDDAAWARIVGNFRQTARFARMGGFAGVALDVEYIAEMYDVDDYPAYQVPGYPKDRLRGMAKERGRAIMTAMLDGYPDMIFWHLPEVPAFYGPLATDLLAGMVDAMARADAPGGVHLCTEGTYTETNPATLLRRTALIEAQMRDSLRSIVGPRALDYWVRRGTIATGLWPLGYYREVTDSTGKLLGYTGRDEKHHGALVGSYMDKSGNYPPEDFRRQHGASRLLSRRFQWIYGHGTVLWQMTPEELARYRGGLNDSLPVDPRLDEYLAVIRSAETIADSDYVALATAVRNGAEIPRLPGYAPRWQVIGPWPNSSIAAFGRAYPPEAGIDLGATYPAVPSLHTGASALRWRPIEVDRRGYINLKRNVGAQDTVLAYAAAWIELDRPQRVRIGIGTNDYGALYLGGRKVWSHLKDRGAEPDTDVLLADLPAGRTPVLLKIGDVGGANWGFYLRVTDPAGMEIPDMRWVDAVEEPANVTR